MKRALPLFLSGTTQPAKEKKSTRKRGSAGGERKKSTSYGVLAKLPSESPSKTRKFVELKLEPSIPPPLSQTNPDAKEKRRRLSRKEMAMVSDEQLMRECERVLCVDSSLQKPDEEGIPKFRLSTNDRNESHGRRREFMDDGKSGCQKSEPDFVIRVDPPMGSGVASKPAGLSYRLSNSRSCMQAMKGRAPSSPIIVEKDVSNFPQKKIGFANVLAEIMSDDSL